MGTKRKIIDSKRAEVLSDCLDSIDMLREDAVHGEEDDIEDIAICLMMVVSDLLERGNSDGLKQLASHSRRVIYATAQRDIIDETEGN